MKNLLLRSIIYTLILSLLWLSVPQAQAAAGTLTALSNTMSRLKKNESTTQIIKFTTSVAVNTSNDTIAITFPSDFDFTSADYTILTFTHGASTGLENTEVMDTAPDATKWGAVFSGTENRVMTLTTPTDGVGAAALAANDKVIITYDSAASINPSTAGSYTISIAIGGDNTASGKIGVVIVDDDQVGVTATVDPTLTFSISDTTIGFGSFVGTAVRYATGDLVGSATVPSNGAPVILTAATNGIGGWAITVRDTGSGSAAGLYAAAPLSELIPASASTAVTTGSKTYGVYGKNPAADVTIDECFDHDSVGTCSVTGSTTDAAIHHSNAYRFAYTAAPSGDKTLDLTAIAAVNATTKAGQYSDTITVICTGNY